MATKREPGTMGVAELHEHVETLNAKMAEIGTQRDALWDEAMALHEERAPLNAELDRRAAAMGLPRVELLERARAAAPDGG
jgi:hypothetical protein